MWAGGIHIATLLSCGTERKNQTQVRKVRTVLSELKMQGYVYCQEGEINMYSTERFGQIPAMFYRKSKRKMVTFDC